MSIRSYEQTMSHVFHYGERKNKRKLQPQMHLFCIKVVMMPLILNIIYFLRRSCDLCIQIKFGSVLAVPILSIIIHPLQKIKKI